MRRHLLVSCALVMVACGQGTVTTDRPEDTGDLATMDTTVADTAVADDAVDPGDTDVADTANADTSAVEDTGDAGVADTDLVEDTVDPGDTDVADTEVNDTAVNDAAVDSGDTGVADTEADDTVDPGDTTSPDVVESCEPYAGRCDGDAPSRCRADGAGWEASAACAYPTTCEAGACVGPIAWHLERSVDLQWVHDHPADQLEACVSVEADLAAGRIACDATHGIRVLQPRFGYFLANSWQRIGTDGQTACGGATVDANVTCYVDNLRQLIDRFQTEAPSLLIAGHIAEYVHRDNVTAAEWPSVCRAGTIGQWGPDTCIPDVAGSATARAYLTWWGRRMIDAGVQALVFGQGRVIAGGVADSSAVAPAGAVALAEIIADWRAYAASRGRTVYVGAQATSSVRPAGAGEQLDFVTGALHLEHASHDTLVIPLLDQGPMIASHYGDGDWHDANLLVNASGLPVLLDYDNSGEPARDDIRTLAAISDPLVRAQTLVNHAHLLHLYNPDARLSMPLAKTLATDGDLACFGVNPWHFSLSGCALLGAVEQAWAREPTPTSVLAPLGETAPPIDRVTWGQQLRDRHVLVSWFYQVFFARPADLGGYAYYVSELPALVNQGDGPRADLAASLLASDEFGDRGLSTTEVVTLIYAAFLLREPDADGLSYWSAELGSAPSTDAILGVMRAISASEEAAALYAP